MSSSLGEAVLDLVADSSPLKNSLGDAKGVVESSLGTLGNVARNVLAVGVGVATAAMGGLADGLGVAMSEAMEGQTALAHLDAVLKSTGAAAAEQANQWAAAQGRFVSSTAMSSEELSKLQDELTWANAKLSDMQVAWDKTDTHTETAALRLQDAKDKVAELEAAIASGAQTITTSLADSMGLVPPVAQMTRDELLKLADSLQDVTVFSDDTIISGESMLLTFTKIGKDVFPQATEAILNLSTKFGGVEQSAIQLGKALNDPITGVGALRKVGVTLSEQQEAQVKKFVEMGDVASAQKIILAELEVEFGGVARAVGETFGGQLTIAKNRLLDVAEGIGANLLPVMQDFFTNVIEPGIPLIEKIGETIGYMIGDIASGDIGVAVDDLREGLMGILPQNVIDGLANFMLIIRDNLPVALANASAAIQTLSGFWTNTLQPAIVSVWSWASTTLLPFLEQLWTWLAANLPGAIQTLSSFWTGTLLPAITTAWGWMQANLIPALTELWGWLAANLPGAIQTLSDFWTGTLLPAFITAGEWLKANWPTISAAVETAFNAIVAAAQWVIEAAGNIWAAFQEHMPQIQAAVQTAIDFILNMWNSFGPTIVTNVQTILAQLQEFWANHGEQIMAFVQAAFTNIGTQITVTMALIFATISGALTLVSGLIAATMQIINGDWEGAWQTIKDTLESFIEGILSAVGTNLDELTATWKTNWEMLKTIVSTVAENVKTAIGEWLTGVAETLANGISNAIDGVQGVITGFADVGKAIVDGMIGGIVGAVGGLVQAAIDAALSAFNAAKDALGIHSPSSVFAGIGSNMMAGMALGLKRSAYMPQAVLSNLSSSIAEGARGGSIQTTNQYFNLSLATRESTGNAMNDFAVMQVLAGA